MTDRGISTLLVFILLLVVIGVGVVVAAPIVGDYLASQPGGTPTPVADPGAWTVTVDGTANSSILADVSVQQHARRIQLQIDYRGAPPEGVQWPAQLVVTNATGRETYTAIGSPGGTIVYHLPYRADTTAFTFLSQDGTVVESFEVTVSDEPSLTPSASGDRPVL